MIRFYFSSVNFALISMRVPIVVKCIFEVKILLGLKIKNLSRVDSR